MFAENMYLSALNPEIRKIGWKADASEDGIVLDEIEPSEEAKVSPIIIDRSCYTGGFFTQNIAHEVSSEIFRCKLEMEGSSAPEAEAKRKKLEKLCQVVRQIEEFDIPVIWKHSGVVQSYGMTQQKAAEALSVYQDEGHHVPAPNEADNPPEIEDYVMSVNMDEVELDPPELTKLQQRIFDDCARFAGGCSYMDAIRMSEESEPRFRIVEENGTPRYVSWMEYGMECDDIIMKQCFITIYDWMQYFKTVEPFLSEDNAHHFFEKLEAKARKNNYIEWAIDSWMYTAPGTSYAGHQVLFSFDEHYVTVACENYWKSDISGYTLETLEAINKKINKEEE